MRHTEHLLLALALSVAVGCGSDVGGSVPRACDDVGAPGSCGIPCSIDDDCGIGTFCYQGSCAAECIENTDCSGIQLCDEVTGRCYDPTHGVICDLPNPPLSCGDSCTIDADCGVDGGTYCFMNHCSANCQLADIRCPDNFTCSTQGRCEPEGGGGCIDVEVNPSRLVPNVVFLIDRSGSMSGSFGTTTRWLATKAAIQAVVQDLESIVAFGYTTYSGDGGANCPELSQQVMVLNNFVNFNDANYPATIQNNTPTGDSIDDLVPWLDDHPGPGDGPTIIVLATDGEPDTCEQPNPDQGQEEALTAAANAYSEGYPLFILSVGSDVSATHLQQMANVGIGLPRNEPAATDATYWTANDPTALGAAFETIVTAQISCDVALGGTILDDDRVCEGVVTLDGVELECGTEWQLKPGTLDTIQLLGSVCDDWKTLGDPDVLSATFPCDVIDPG